MWEKLAELTELYLKKGSLVYLEGKMQTRSWEKDGVKQYKTEIVAYSMQFLDSKPKQEPTVFDQELPSEDDLSLPF